MAVTADKVVTILQADVDSHIANINKAEANYSAKVTEMAATTNAAASQISKIGAAAGKSFNTISQQAPRATTAIRGARVETGNLAAQLNDIGVQLAGGQSPFLVAIQQGSQINQVIGQAGAAGAVSALRGAFVSLLNPVSLATFAIIGLGGAAVQYFTEFLSSSDDSEEALKRQAKLIEAVADKWGDAVPLVKEYADELKRANDEAQLREVTKLTIDEVFKEAREQVRLLNVDFVDLLSQLGGQSPEAVRRLETAFAALQKAIEEGRDSTKENQELLSALSAIYINTGIPAADSFAKKIFDIGEAFKEVARQAEAARIAEEKALSVPGFVQPGGGGFRRNMPLPGTAPIPSTLGVGDVGPNPAFRSFEQSLTDAGDAIDGFVDRVIRVESGGNANAKNPASTATGVGQFLEKTWLDLFRKYYPESANMGREAILELRKDADVSRVLIRKYAEENARILQAAGVHVNEAALQLSHFLGAGDAAKVLSAAPGTPLAGLISAASIRANPTILGGGRTVEDAIAYANNRASGSGAASGGARSRQKTPAELFQGDTRQVQERIDLINAEIEAMSRLNPAVKTYGFEVEKAKIEQQLLNDAKRAGLTITPELAASIDTLAGNYAKASTNAEQLRQKQADVAEAAQEFNAFSQDVLGGFIRDLQAGKSASEALAGALQKVADRLLDMALNMIFPTQGGGGGGLGGLLQGFLGLFRERGGPVRKGQPYIVGEKRPELFIPESNGRIVPRVPNPSMPSRGGAIQEVMLYVRGEPGPQFIPTIRAEAQGVAVKVSQVAVSEHDKQINRSMGSRIAMAQTRQR